MSEYRKPSRAELIARADSQIERTRASASEVIAFGDPVLIRRAQRNHRAAVKNRELLLTYFRNYDAALSCRLSEEVRRASVR